MWEEGDILLADGFESAFLGVTNSIGDRPSVAVYARDRCLEILQTRDGMTMEEAEEYFAFNVEGAWVGKQTPLFLYSLPLNDLTQETPL